MAAPLDDGTGRERIMDSFNGGCSAAEPYALRVIGDSMAPEFRDGHIIIVDPGLPAVHGAYVVADYRGETIFRQFVVEGEARYLKPLNEAFPAIRLDGEYRIRGVVIQRGGTRRKEIKHYSYG